jgi:hypothetical protein
MKKKIYIGEVIMAIFSFGLIGIILAIIFSAATLEEIETYIVGAEISHMDYSAYHVRNSGARTKYIIAVRNDEFATVFEVSDSEYAEKSVGDIVEIEVRTTADLFGEYTEYNYLG